MPALPQRKNLRLTGAAYSQGWYFVTVCTDQRREILGKVVGGGVLDAPTVRLLEYGMLVR